MFRAMTSPVSVTPRLFFTPGKEPVPIVQEDVAGHRPATSWVYYTTSCKQSLVLLKMGEIIAQNKLR